MVRACRCVRDLGGLEQTNSFTRLYLALAGVIGWDMVPAMVNSIFALMSLGYVPNHPVTSRQIDELSRFEIEEANTIRLQPCLSPVWDTAIAAFTLIEADSACDDTVRQAAEWLLEKQIL